MPDDRSHYLVRVTLEGRTAFLVWYTDDRDGFARDPAGRFLTAPTAEGLTAAAAACGIRLVTSEVYRYDLDQIAAWCVSADGDGIDCRAFLDAWNLFDDLAGLHDRPGTGYARLSRAASSRYDKLFWGNNLPGVTPPGERYDPDWRPEEVAEIRRVMEAGLTLVRESLGEIGGPCLAD